MALPAVDLSAYAGKTIGTTALVTEGYTPAGSWTIAYTDLALISTDGTVWPFYTGQSTVDLSPYGADGSTRTYAVGNQPGAGWPTLSTVYYHGDQIGSSRLITNYNGYPVWQGTFLPYGEEYNAQIGTYNAQMNTNHYKFTGKERDDESGLDYFGARYYSNGLGRFITPDWAAKAAAVPYADFADPQSLNLYTYVRNIPTTKVDPDGHDDCCTAEIGWVVLAYPGAVGAVTGALATAGEAVISTVLSPVAALSIVFSSTTMSTHDTLQVSTERFKVPKQGVSGKEAASDVPEWVKIYRPKVGEAGRDFAKRILKEKYGEDWDGNTGPDSEFNKIKKYGDRKFEDPPPPPGAKPPEPKPTPPKPAPKPAPKPEPPQPKPPKKETSKVIIYRGEAIVLS
jgi:RHS repeat-associated protein